MLSEHIVDTALRIVLALVLVARFWIRQRLHVSEDDRRRPRDQVAQDVGEVLRRVEAVERRMETASASLSRLTSTVQQLPDDIRALYVPRELAQQWLTEFERLRDKVERRR
jgi:septal ring factor EnvC (AmiA/AmiB activator)